MRAQHDLSSFIGRVRVWNVDDPDNYVEGFNDVLYQGADVIARLLAGQNEYRIAKFWFEFDNGGPATVTQDRTDTATTVRAEATGTRDIITGPLVAQPLLESSDPNYLSNRGTYHGLSSGIVGEEQSLAFGAGSSIIALCLAAAPTGLFSGEVLYARFGLGTALTVGSSAQVSGTWQTEAL